MTAKKARCADDDTTRIEIFDITDTGFNYDACQQALTELDSESPNLGNLKSYVDDCMGYVSGNQTEYLWRTPWPLSTMRCRNAGIITSTGSFSPVPAP